MTDWQTPIDECLVHLRAELEGMKPPDAVVHTHGVVEAWGSAQPVLAELRKNALRRAIEEGWTQADLANLLGVSRQRIHQLMLDGKPTPTPRKRKSTK